MFFTETAAVGDLPNHTGDVILQELLGRFQLERDRRQKREESVTDGVHGETAADLEQGAFGCVNLVSTAVLGGGDAGLRCGFVGGRGDVHERKKGNEQGGWDQFHRDVSLLM